MSREGRPQLMIQPEAYFDALTRPVYGSGEGILCAVSAPYRMFATGLA